MKNTSPFHHRDRIFQIFFISVVCKKIVRIVTKVPFLSYVGRWLYNIIHAILFPKCGKNVRLGIKSEKFWSRKCKSEKFCWAHVKDYRGKLSKFSLLQMSSVVLTHTNISVPQCLVHIAFVILSLFLNIILNQCKKIATFWNTKAVFQTEMASLLCAF